MPLDHRRKVAIVGFCDTSRDMTPYEDPSYEIWQLNRAALFSRRADRWFEMHGRHIFASQDRRPGKHLEFLRNFPGPVYVHERFPELGDNQVVYPLQEVAEDLGALIYRIGPNVGPCHEYPCARTQHSTSGHPGVGCSCKCHSDEAGLRDSVADPYLASSIAYEIALAIHERFEEIALFGIDLSTGAEYAWQKPGVEYLLGVAAGRGIRVMLPGNCPLLRGTLYGRGYMSELGEHMSYDNLNLRKDAVAQEQRLVNEELAKVVGARRELAFIQEQMVPGLDHEKLEDRRKAMDQNIAVLQRKLYELQGALTETAYWIHQTMEGQEPGEAIAQIAELQHGAEGPLTELDELQSIDPAAQRDGHVPAAAIPVGVN